MPRKIEFTKMHGAGNDYIYVDVARFPLADPERLATLWSDRHKGIGGDGLVLIGPSSVGDFSMRIFNSDGSEARMCGNASRCIGKYVYEHGLTRQTVVRLETASGVKVLRLEIDAGDSVARVTVDMGKPSLREPSQLAVEGGELVDGTVMAGRAYRGTFVSMGNPHFVSFVADAEKADVANDGVALEHAAAFPERCNVEFASLRPDGSIRMRVWERGSGITMACGTGACATAVAAYVTGRAGRRSTIVMDGGALDIEYREADGHVYMTGSATEVFTGTIDLPEDAE